MKKKVLSIIATAEVLSACGGQSTATETMQSIIQNPTQSSSKTSLLVWSDMEGDDLVELAENNGIGEIWLATNGLDHTPTAEDVQSHTQIIQQLSASNLKVSYLCGDPRWEEADIIQSIEAVADSDFSALVLDWEPYTLDDYDPSAWFAAMQAGKSRADELGVELIMCIPYWLDRDFLEQLVDCCDINIRMQGTLELHQRHINSSCCFKN